MNYAERRAWNVRRIFPYAWFAVCCAAFGLLLALFAWKSAEPQGLPVLLPLSTAVLSAGCFLWGMQRRVGAIPFFEVGVVYAAVVTLYTIYPLIGYLANGMSYTPFNDGRLVVYGPTPIEIGGIGWYYVAHLIAFLCTYLYVRGRAPVMAVRVARLPERVLPAAGVLYLLISIFFLILDRIFGLYAGSYQESYAAFNQLPGGIAQVASLLDGARFPVEVVILATLFLEYRKYRLVIVGWLVWVMLLTFIQLGNRTELILLLMAATMFYHYLVRRLTMRFVIVSGFAGLVLFLALGLLRSGFLFSGIGASYNPFGYASEFEVIFGNAFDLSIRMTTGSLGNVPIGFYVSDLVLSLPRQLLPFDKILPAEWYVTTFFPIYAAAGGGLAFGTISESVLGAGVLDALLRGAALGLILGYVHRYSAARGSSFWVFVCYIWLATQVYQSFRNTTFVGFYLFLYRFLWVAIIIQLLASFRMIDARRLLTPTTHL